MNARTGPAIKPSPNPPIIGKSQEGADFDVTWVVPPTFEAGSGEPAMRKLRDCEYSPTGYFGNEGGEAAFYVYAALQVTIPPLGKGGRPRPARARTAVKKAAQKR